MEKYWRLFCQNGMKFVIFDSFSGVVCIILKFRNLLSLNLTKAKTAIYFKKLFDLSDIVYRLFRKNKQSYFSYVPKIVEGSISLQLSTSSTCEFHNALELINFWF